MKAQNYAPATVRNKCWMVSWWLSFARINDSVVIKNHKVQALLNKSQALCKEQAMLAEKRVPSWRAEHRRSEEELVALGRRLTEKEMKLLPKRFIKKLKGPMRGRIIFQRKGPQKVKSCCRSSRRCCTSPHRG